MITSLVFAILAIPTVYELINDRHGESITEKAKDVPRRAFLMIVSAMVVAFIIMWDTFPWRTNEHVWPYAILSLKCLFLSFAIFFFTFDYAITTILIHRGVIETKENAFSYVGKTSKFDKFKLWVRIGAWGRFVVKLAVFVVALIIYF